jgi:hypothetical protein
MRIACIIMAHKDPRQLERFIRTFQQEGFDFYLHIDRKSDVAPFRFLENLQGVQLIKNRIPIRWASYNFFRAITLALTEALSSGKKYDYVSVMSGQDYLLRPAKEWFDYLSANDGKNFICYEDDGEWWKHAITRIRKYHLTNWGFRGRYRLQNILNALLPARKFPLPYRLYGGPRAMCMTITRPAAEYVIRFLKEDRQLRRFLRFTWGPDEFVFPTVLMNSEFRSSIVNDNFYYIDWTQGGVNPKTFTSADYEALKASGKFLARKFDITLDSKILDRLDRERGYLGSD